MIAAPTLVDTPMGLAQAVERAMSAPRIALDLEANGRFAYRATLSMMQLAWGDEVTLVDPIAPGMHESLGVMQPLFGDTGPVKVIHDVGFDARILAEAGLTLGNVHDTALMAQWLGRPATGLASLALTELGVTLDKSLQAQDWAARPLSPEGLVYLANDVLHLFALDDRLFAEATAAEILPELLEEISYRLRASERAVREPDRRPPYARLKGVDKVPRDDLPVLRRVAQARASEAERLDAPEGELVPTAVLFAIARARPATPRDLARIRSPIARKDTEAVGRALLEAVRLGKEDAEIPTEDRVWFEHARLPQLLIKERREREARLSAWRKATAALRKVSEQVVLPGHCAADLVVEAPGDKAGLDSIAGLGAFRITRYGDMILQALRGPTPAPDTAAGLPPP